MVLCVVSQGVHESKGASNDYLKLESLVQKVVSPYLGTHGLFSSDGSITQSSCVLGEQILLIKRTHTLLKFTQK